MDSLYYEKQFKVGPDGEKLSLMAIDSCFLICEDVGPDDDAYISSLDGDSLDFYNNKCKIDDVYMDKNLEMKEWINQTMTQQIKDDSIVWKSTNMHHMMFGLHYTDN